jgi:hypothetical protein
VADARTETDRGGGVAEGVGGRVPVELALRARRAVAAGVSARPRAAAGASGPPRAVGWSADAAGGEAPTGAVAAWARARRRLRHAVWGAAGRRRARRGRGASVPLWRAVSAMPSLRLCSAWRTEARGRRRERRRRALRELPAPALPASSGARCAHRASGRWRPRPTAAVPRARSRRPASSGCATSGLRALRRGLLVARRARVVARALRPAARRPQARRWRSARAGSAAR